MILQHRFSVTIRPQADMTQDQAQDLLDKVIEAGLVNLGHTATTLPITVEKLRRLSVDKDLKS
jgi:hypothetical protein